MDTGAEVCVISKKWAKKHPELARATASYAIESAFGSTLENPELLFAPLQSTEDGDTIEIECAVAPLNSKYELLLSEDACRTLGLSFQNADAATSVPSADLTPLAACLSSFEPMFQPTLPEAGLVRVPPIRIFVPEGVQV